MLTTSVGGVWVLQALVGVESMPAALRLKPFIPSIHESLIVQTTQGPRPLSQTAEYAALHEAGVIDGAGRVDDMVRDWMTVLGRPDREVVLSVRHPAPPSADPDARIVEERVMVVCRHRRWMAMAARDGDEMVVGPVGEADDGGRQAELMCHTLIPAFGQGTPADIDGANVLLDLVTTAMSTAAPHGRPAVSTALSRLGLPPSTVQAVAAAHDLDRSAMAVVAVLDHGAQVSPQARVLTVADTDLGRISFTVSTAADGKRWMSIWPTTVEGLRADLTELLSAPAAAAA